MSSPTNKIFFTPGSFKQASLTSNGSIRESDIISEHGLQNPIAHASDVRTVLVSLRNFYH